MDIMQAIIDIEKKARSVAEHAEELQRDYELNLNAEIEDKKKKNNDKINETLNQYKLRTDAECKEEAEKLEKLYEEKLEHLSEIYKKNKDSWVDQITAKVTGL